MKSNITSKICICEHSITCYKFSFHDSMSGSNRTAKISAAALSQAPDSDISSTGNAAKSALLPISKHQDPLFQGL